MATKGFIIDAPNAMIQTKNNTTSILTGKSASVKIAGSSVDISGGWGTFNLAEIDTKNDLTIEISDAEWKLDTMALTSGGTLTTGSGEDYHFGEEFTVVTNKITIPYVITAKSLIIDGFTETSEATPAAKEFKVTIAASSTDVLFNTSVVDGTVISPSYTVTVASNVETLSVKTTDFPKSGKVVLKFPVYESDDDESGIAGYGQFIIYKAKIKADTEMGGQYKSASEQKISLKGLDPRRPDGKMWDFQYIPVVA